MRERAVFGRVCQRLDAVLRAYTTFPLAHCHPQRRRVVLLDLTSVNCGGDAVRVWSPSSSGVSASALDGKGQVLKTGHMETIDASDFNARCLASKDIKNLNVGVCPPNDRVRVAVPLRLGDNAVPLALISRMGWIRRQQAGFENQDRQSQRAFVTAGRIFVLTEAPGFQGGSSLGWTSCLSCGTSLLHRGCIGAGTGWSFRR